MTIASHDRVENISFVIFIILTVLTALSLSFEKFWLSGFMVLCWGFYSGWRYLSLRLPLIQIRTSLPGKLLQILTMRDAHESNVVWGFQTHPIFFFWLAMGIGWILWIGLCSIYNFFPPALSSFHAMLSDALPNIKADLRGPITFLFCLSAAVFWSRGYALRKLYVRQSMIILYPLLCIGVAMALLQVGTVDEVFMLSPHYPVGSGVGQTDLFFQIFAEYRAYDTSLFRRFVETGWVGAISPYLLGLPAFFTLISMASKRYSSRQPDALVGLATIILLIFIDIFVQYSSYNYGLFIVGWVVLTLSWGLCSLRPIRKYHLHFAV